MQKDFSNLGVECCKASWLICFSVNMILQNIFLIIKVVDYEIALLIGVKK